METTFADFMDELEGEAKAEGQQALEQFHAFGRYFASVAIQLAARRRAKGLTQQELGLRAGIQQAEISRIEKGRGNPTLKTLASLGTALDVPIVFGAKRQATKHAVARRKVVRRAATKTIRRRASKARAR